jgi:hypothetical protein
MGHHAEQTALLPGVFSKPVTFAFDTKQASSDGGALLLAAVEHDLGLTNALVTCINDQREQGKVTHKMANLLRQRVFGYASGYEDCNDATRLRDDPVMLALKEGSPSPEIGLASQPTLSRLENSIMGRDIRRLMETFVDVVLAACQRRYGRNASLITIDLDPTVDPTHGGQQLTFFNAFYDTHCYLPLTAFISFNREPEMHLAALMLRPGNAGATVGAIELLERLLPKLKDAFPKATIRFRADGGFAAPEFLDFLDAWPRLQYVVNMPQNTVLSGLAEPWMKAARRESRKVQEARQVFGDFRYEAKSWENERRIVVKAEVTYQEDRSPKDNPRFVVTNLRHHPERVYEIYRQRAECENRIKELKYDMAMDRTSCHGPMANQFRLILTGAAYVLMQELRWHARGTSLERAQVGTLRLRLLKMGARIVETTRRIVVHCPQNFPSLGEFIVVARRLRARLT